MKKIVKKFSFFAVILCISFLCSCGITGDAQTTQKPVHVHKVLHWQIAAEADCTEAGRRFGICIDCENEVREEISAFGHEYIDGKCVRCGDSSVSGVFTFAIDAQSRGYVLTGVTDANITDVTVPSEYMGLPVVSIGSGAFRRMKISSVIIPEGVKRISYGAFEECSLLETAELPSTLEVIEDYAFSKCVSLQTAELPLGLTDLGERAFYGCSSLVYVSLPENIAEIKAYTFADCVSLRTAELPSGCVDIKEYAFYGCRRLDSVTLPPSLDTIGAYAFACSGVENMDFPRTLERICERAFEKTFLREVEIQPFTVVESKAFAECLYLESVTYSSYITGHDASGKPVYPGSDTFYGCENLKYVKLDCIETAYAMFENCVSLERVNITRALAFLRPDTFRGCKLIEVIEYEGSESEWNNIAKPVDWAGYSADYNLIFGV